MKMVNFTKKCPILVDLDSLGKSAQRSIDYLAVA